jgi:DeoR/GlpR family transcriptional regulator of sugar metabolism
MGINAELRHKTILENLKSTGRIYVKDTAEKMGVTEVTVRRDLTYLEKNGLLKKIYGGAVPSAPQVRESVTYREKRKITAKRIIGELASDLIEDGDVIYLGSGSTCNEIIPHLSEKKNLTIIVNSLYLMKRLGELSQHKIIIVGGQYRFEQMDMVGPGAELAISQLGGFKAFTGADDVSVNGGISGADVVTVGFAKLILQKAAKVILVSDYTKFDNPALYKIADIDNLDYIVTNTKPKPQWLKISREKDIKLIYPKITEFN